MIHLYLVDPPDMSSRVSQLHVMGRGDPTNGVPLVGRLSDRREFRGMYREEQISRFCKDPRRRIIGYVFDLEQREASYGLELSDEKESGVFVGNRHEATGVQRENVQLSFAVLMEKVESERSISSIQLQRA